MKIREATVGDLRELVRLMESFHGESVYGTAPMDVPSVITTFELLIAADVGCLFVTTTDEGKVVGATGAIKTPTWWNKNIFSAAEFMWYVEPDHRRSKAGKLLFQALETWAKESGCSYMAMASAAGKHQKRVNRIYESRSYRPVETVFIKEM